MRPGPPDQPVPGPLLLRAASASLAVLRTHEGLSPELRARLREAAQELRDAVEDSSRREAVKRAASLLRDCLAALPSGVEGGEKLRTGVASVLGHLAQFLGDQPFPVADTGEDWAIPVGARPVPATIALPQMVTPTPEPTHGFSVAATLVLESSAPPAMDGAQPSLAPPSTAIAPVDLPPEAAVPSLSEQLLRIERAYGARAGCIDAPNATFAELQAAERRIRACEAKACELLAARTGSPSDDGASELPGTGTWWLSGQRGQLVSGGPSLASALAKVAADPAEKHRIAIDVLRLNPAYASTTDVWAVLRGPALMGLRARCLPLLFQNHLPDGEALVKMLDEPAMAMAAAAALPWCRIREGGQRLLEKALVCPSAELSDALLFASLAQGDRESISEVRIRLAGGSVSGWLIDALAVAGDEADADLLSDVATNPESPAEYTIWALAHLGAPSAVARMRELEARARPGLVERAIELMVGRGDTHSTAAGRVVDGEPWSVAAMLRRLAFPAELPLPILRWTALDLPVRTGQSAPCIYDIAASAEHQQSAGRSFAACYAACPEPGRGGWHYFGRPAAAAG